MKIKTTKKLNLPELIQYVWEFESSDSENNHQFESSTGKVVSIDGGAIKVDSLSKIILRSETFTVEVEENVTPTTRFDELTEYIYDDSDNRHFTAKHKGANISLIIDCETHQFKTQAIYCKDTLIWSKEHGIPEDGVLEVD